MPMHHTHVHVPGHAKVIHHATPRGSTRPGAAPASHDRRPHLKQLLTSTSGPSTTKAGIPSFNAFRAQTSSIPTRAPKLSAPSSPSAPPKPAKPLDHDPLPPSSTPPGVTSTPAYHKTEVASRESRINTPVTALSNVSDAKLSHGRGRPSRSAAANLSPGAVDSSATSATESSLDDRSTSSASTDFGTGSGISDAASYSAPNSSGTSDYHPSQARTDSEHWEDELSDENEEGSATGDEAGITDDSFSEDELATPIAGNSDPRTRSVSSEPATVDAPSRAGSFSAVTSKTRPDTVAPLEGRKYAVSDRPVVAPPTRSSDKIPLVLDNPLSQVVAAASRGTKVGDNESPSAKLSTRGQVTQPVDPGKHSQRDQNTQGNGQSRTRRSDSVEAVPTAGIPRSKSIQPGNKMASIQEGLPRSISDNTIGSVAPLPGKKLDPAPSKLSSFFSWKSSTPRDTQADPGTLTALPEAAEGSPYSPIRLDRSASEPRLVSGNLDSQRILGLNYSASTIAEYAPPTPGFGAVEGLERELKEIAEELAESIRREMDLEDALEIARAEQPLGDRPRELTRRGSDYFSDSGESTNKFSTREADTRIEELERAVRKAEQDRAAIKADLTARVANEQRRRRDLEFEVAKGVQDRAGNDAERIKELEQLLEESRRKLSRERESRDNVEDLMAALRTELTEHRNERDDFRDNVVPQLKARIQELESLDRGNFATYNGPGRSNSVAHSASAKGPSRSGSVRGHEPEPSAADRIKDIEEQRDALQKALQQVVKRNEHARKEHAKQIQRLLADNMQSAAPSPTKSVRSGFSRDVRSLRDEVGNLRKRADEAVMQKWQCETNLGGVKMALDRASQETRQLRTMLDATESPISAVSDDGDHFSIDGGNSTMRRGITAGQAEFTGAHKEAIRYREAADALGNSADEVDRAQAEQLSRSADMMESLAGKVQRNLEMTEQLCQKLSTAVSRGEREQSSSAAHVTELQSRLKGLEEAVSAAQQQSEMNLSLHEEEARALSVTSPQLHRLQIPASVGNIVGPPSSISQTSTITSMLKSPLGLGKMSTRYPTPSRGKAESLMEASKTTMLQKRVRELEQCVTDADIEMKMIVSRIEHSQGEIAQLQGEKDEVARQLRRLQKEIYREKQKVLPLLG